MITNGASGNGGGNANGGAVTLNDSTITGNTASTGGGIANFGTVTLTDSSSITGNAAKTSGGGIYNLNGGSPGPKLGKRVQEGNARCSS